jgi:competence protein ComFC
VGWRWCPDCQARVPRIHTPFCEKCGIPTPGTNLCEKCKRNPPAYRIMRSWAVFDSPVQNGLHTMKYRGNVSFGESIAEQMTDFVRSLRWPVDVMIPVPLGKKRLKERGYNQVALVAEPLSYQLGWRYEPDALRKVRETRSQVGLNISQRGENVQDAYQADPNVVKNATVLIMDDVATTGSTIAACTTALLSAEAREVYVVTIARALAHHSLDRV